MNIKATIVQHVQGTEAWQQHRAHSLNASELAAAMGVSSYMSRAALIKQKATGIVPEIDAATQRRFDKGHEFEAIARPWAEEIIGEDLYASVFAAEVDGLPLSASLDGHTLLNEVTWEHKTLSASLAESLDNDVIPEQYLPQLEMGLMLTGASKCLFMASNGDRETMRSAWYVSNPDLRAKIIPTWKQFQADVEAYDHTAPAEKVAAEYVESLPAVSVRMDGSLAVTSNLDLFGQKLKAFVEGLDKNPTTDQAFANCEAAVKTLKAAEDALDQAEAAALAQIDPVEAMRRTVADYRELARTTRLALDKLVKARKNAIKGDIVAAGSAALEKHVNGLNKQWPGQYLPLPAADFWGCIKGLKSVDSIKNAVDTELANAKIAANETADRINRNLQLLKGEAHDWTFLFPDLRRVAAKESEDFAALLSSRIAAHKAATEAEKAREALKDAPIRQAAKPAATGDTIKLGDINARLSPLSITSAGLAELGFESVGKERTSVLFRASDFPAICDAILSVVERAKAQKELVAA